MVTQITVSVPDNVYQRAKALSQLIDQDIETILSMMLELSLPRFVPDIDLSRPVESLENDILVAATQLRLLPEQSERHSTLLKQQQNTTLSMTEENELKTLNHVYELGIVYQSQALAEAVKRGLIKGLTDEKFNS